VPGTVKAGRSTTRPSALRAAFSATTMARKRCRYSVGLIENWIDETERRSWFLTVIGPAQ
jgi:hypothetical protein